MHQLNQPSTLNGYHPAPPASGGAFAAKQPRTVFPEETLRPAFTTLLYDMSRGVVGGTTMLRWLQWFFIAGAVLWAGGWLPGRWWVTITLVVLWVALQVTLVRQRRRNFVKFRPEMRPAVAGQALAPSTKLAIFATGRFTVEGKQQSFTWLPGFYRTFATREHALLCRVADRRMAGVGRWPAAEQGLWYVFFQPAQIVDVQWGSLTFGHNQRSALAVRYLPISHTESKRRRTQPREETLFIALQTEADGLLILADLLHDRPLVNQ